MIPEWINQGIDPVIMTYNVCGDWGINVPIYRISQFEISKPRIPSSRSEHSANLAVIAFWAWSKFVKIPFLGSIFNLIKKKSYYNELYKIAKKIIKEHNIQIVFSFANPQESNILGAMMAKKLGVKFVSHFSDPWYDNPYKTFSKLGGKKVLALEKFIIKNSDRVIFINKTAQELVMKKYPADWFKKSLTIPHCYDLKDYPDTINDKPLSDKFVLSYIGAFYKERNPEPLFKALKIIIDTDKNFADKFVIKLIGAANDYAGYSAEKIENMLNAYDLRKRTEIIPPISYKESLKYMKLSDCLIVIDADMTGSPFLPSKVVDYAGSGNFIIGITPTDSPTDIFLKNLGYKSFNYNQVNELAVYLEKLILEEIKISINQNFLRKYDVRNTTAKLINIFNEVLS